MMRFELRSNICRICLQEGELLSIYQKDEDGIVICDKIVECSGVTINRNTILPENICKECFSLLSFAYKFQTICKKSDSILQLFLKNTDNKDILITLNNGSVYKLPQGLNINVLQPIQSASHASISAEEDISKDLNNDISDITETESQYETESTIFEEKEVQDIAPSVQSDTGSLESDEKKPEETNVSNSRSKSVQMCEICGNSYKYKSALETHVRRHRNEKPFSCEICGRCFAVNGQLTCHMRTHTGQKPYSCQFCGRRFADIGARHVHERIHTGERPFACKICGKTFTYASVLKKHLFIHSGEKHYRCDKCGVQFRFHYHLKAHYKTSRHQNSAADNT